MGDGFYGSATGKKIIYRVIADCLVKDGKVIEEWIIRDEGSILRQLGYKTKDFVEQKIKDNTFTKEDMKFTKNSFVKKNLIRECKNEFAKKYENSFTDLINKKPIDIKKLYDRSAQLYWFGGDLIYTYEKIFEKWNLFLSCFKILKYEVSNSIGLNELEMRPRAALRWRLTCKHDYSGIFGLPSNKEIKIYGISHAEFSKDGIVREYVLIDEISIWKQILI